MRHLLRTVATMLAWASSSLALRWHVGHANATPGSRLQSLAGESFSLQQLGEHVLLRAPPELGKPALLRVSGHFSSHMEAPCAVYADTVVLVGQWLGSQALRVSIVNRTLHVKVSEGPWRSVRNYTTAKAGLEAMPDTMEITTARDGTGITFYAGPGESYKRPTIEVRHGLRAGLDVSLSNLEGFGLPEVAGLLGSYKHNKTIEEPSRSCKKGPAEAASVVHILAKHEVHSTQLRNVLHKTFTMQQVGVFSLLRVPRDATLPPLISVEGSFVSNPYTMCIVFLQRLALSGAWLGNNTARVSTQGGTLNIQVSSPKVAGRVRSINNFVEIRNGPEGLPRTAKVTRLLDGPSFKFVLGEGKLTERLKILATRTLHGGLDVKVWHMEGGKEEEIGGLLGTENHSRSLETPSEQCKGRRPARIGALLPAKVEPLTAGGGSLLIASWVS